MFKRSFKDELIEQLLASPLYKQRLMKDIENGTVFPAIRSERIDFYHKGGKLFTYDGQFKTHLKFASVYRLEEEKNYVTERDLAEPLKCDFKEDYQRIKENCAKFAEQESAGVARVYTQFSYTKSVSEPTVLDIEISFKSDKDDRTQDRIDLLLYNNGILRFYEAKHFSNSEIWARPGAEPKVVEQVRRYKKQIDQNKIEIINQYRTYVNLVNKIFDTKLILPVEVDNNVPVLVFGFDRDQLRGRFKSLFEANLKNKIRYYAIGDISKVKIENMWNACK